MLTMTGVESLDYKEYKGSHDQHVYEVFLDRNTLIYKNLDLFQQKCMNLRRYRSWLQQQSISPRAIPFQDEVVFDQVARAREPDIQR